MLVPQPFPNPGSSPIAVTHASRCVPLRTQGYPTLRTVVFSPKGGRPRKPASKIAFREICCWSRSLAACYCIYGGSGAGGPGLDFAMGGPGLDFAMGGPGLDFAMGGPGLDFETWDSPVLKSPHTYIHTTSRSQRPTRAFVSLIVLFFIFIPQAGLGQANADSDKILQALRSKDYPAAVSLADSVLAAHPRDCRVLSMRGLALRGEGRLDDSLRSFRQALDACPRFVPALEGAAQIEYARRSPDAVPLLEQLISVNPENPTAHAMLAVLQWQRGDCAAAVPHFEKGLSLVQKNPEAEREYAACLLAQGDANRSVDLYRQLMEQSPDPAIRMQFAVALWRAKRLDEALAALSPLVENGSTNSRALAIAAQVAEEKGGTPQAIAWLRQAILANPSIVNNYVLFATFAFNHNSFQVGVDMVNAGLRVLPTAAPLYLARGVLRVQLSQVEAALDDFQEAHRLDPHLSFAEDAIGMIHSQQHDNRGSLEIFREHAEKNPRDPLLQYLYAEALVESPDSGKREVQAEAIRAASQAVKLEPDYQPARDLLARLYLRAGNASAARQQAEEALKRNPDDTVALYQKMMADRSLGQKGEIDALVARLKQLKQSEQETKTRYLLEEVSPTSAVPQQAR
jgi:tetratricopeptide (TPR) repeat protein